MKVLMLNGSAHQKGNTYLSLLEVGKTLEKEGIEYEIFRSEERPSVTASDVENVRKKDVFLMMTKSMNL